LTEISFGKIKAEFKDGQVIIKQINPFLEKEIRRYTKIPENVCSICLLPKDKCQNHPFFLDLEKMPILNGVRVASYYKKNPFNRITEELTFIRSRDNLSPGNLIFIIFKEILKAAILKFKIGFDVITSPPTIYNSINMIIKRAAFELNIPYLPIEEFINYNKKIHSKKKIRYITDIDKIAEIIKLIFKTKGMNFPDINNLLLVDDLIRTGATINRISYLLKKQGIKSVYGFCWLRTIGSDFL